MHVYSPRGHLCAYIHIHTGIHAPRRVHTCRYNSSSCSGWSIIALASYSRKFKNSTHAHALIDTHTQKYSRSFTPRHTDLSMAVRIAVKGFGGFRLLKSPPMLAPKARWDSGGVCLCPRTQAGRGVAEESLPHSEGTVRGQGYLGLARRSIIAKAKSMYVDCIFAG